MRDPSKYKERRKILNKGYRDNAHKKKKLEDKLNAYLRDMVLVEEKSRVESKLNTFLENRNIIIL